MSQTFNIEDPNSFNHQFVNFGEKKYHYVEEGSKDGPLLVLVHGFPELWYCWKYQIDFLARNNYRVIAFDMPGYGQTQVPDTLEAFSLKEICEDLNYIVTKHFNQEKAIFIGHDWGCGVVWSMSLYHPQTVQAMINISVPYHPANKEYLTDLEKIKKLPFLGYQLALKEANIESMDKNVEKVLYHFHTFDQRNPSLEEMTVSIGEDIMEKILKDSVPEYNHPPRDFMEYMLSQYKLQGLKGPTNWYRTSKINHDNSVKLESSEIIHKTLLILGKDDFLTLFKERGEPFCLDLTTKIIEGKHFIQFNNHQEVNKLMLEFLDAYKATSKL